MNAPAPHRTVNATKDFRRLFRPTAIAVVGASADESSISGQPLKFLRQHGYAGTVYPVNPRYREIGGLACHPDMAWLPSAPDVALIAVAAKRVPDVLRQCGEKGVPFAVVLTSGFAEIGAAGALGLSLADLLRLEAASKKDGALTAKAKSVIMVWLGGGPATIDMWDLKPNAPDGIRGEFRPIPTSADGVQISEHLPRMAQVADKVTIVRSLHHTIPAHGPARRGCIRRGVQGPRRRPATRRRHQSAAPPPRRHSGRW